MTELTKLPAEGSFRQYIIDLRHYCTSHDVRQKIEYPCFECHGRGRVVHPNAFNDPNEGYKNAERIPCQRCKGTGSVAIEDYHERFKREMVVAKKKVRRDKAAITREMKILNRALAVFTDGEIETLARLF